MIHCFIKRVHSLVPIHKSTYFRPEIGWSTLTANPSCAVHQDLLVPEQFEVLVNIVWEVAELSDVRGQATGKLPLEGKYYQRLLYNLISWYFENFIFTLEKLCKSIVWEEKLIYPLRFYSHKNCGSPRGWCHCRNLLQPKEPQLLYETPPAPDELLRRREKNY